MSEQTPASFGDNKDTWRTATLVTGFALLISMAANFGGPSSAHASADNPNQLQIAQMSAQQSLSIGGFTTLVLNANGQRIGKLPMNLTPQTGDAESIGE